jgi:mannose-6-phosphate isomerase
VPELLKLLDPSVSVPVLSPHVLADGIAWFGTPAPEFRLYLLDLASAELARPGAGLARPGAGLARPGAELALPGAGPRILLCLDGACVLRAASGDALALNRGDSCFVSAADAQVHATGSARLVLAAPGGVLS